MAGCGDRGVIEPVVIGRATLWNADCREVLDTFPTTAALVSDPPYGMALNTDFTRFTGGNGRRGVGRVHLPVAGDDAPFDPAVWLGFSECILFGANHFWSRLLDGGALVWIKRKNAGRPHVLTMNSPST